MNIPGIGSLACYTSYQQVGEGTYGYVYRATDLKNNDQVALKKLIIHKEISGFPMCFVREIKFLKSLRHKNIVALRDIVTSKGCEHIESDMKTSSNNSKPNQAQIQAQGPGKVLNQSQMIANTADSGRGQDNNNNSNADNAKAAQQEACRQQLRQCGNLYLVFEYIEHDLGGLIDSKYKFSLVAIKCITKQLFEALDYLSEKKVLHRDIKSSNILISNYHHVKLADFGLARTTIGPDGREGMHDLTNNVITMWYKPPELLLGAQRYSFSIDMWSVGCVLAELELGRPLFPGKSELEQLDVIFKTIGTPSEVMWPSLSTLPLYETIYKIALPKYNQSSLRITQQSKLSDSVIELLERILVADPSKRITPKIALLNKFYMMNPIPPENPMDLGPLMIPQGSSFHEYETKKIRKAKEEEIRKEKQQQQQSLQPQSRSDMDNTSNIDQKPVVGIESSITTQPRLAAKDNQHSLFATATEFDSNMSYYNTLSLYERIDQEQNTIQSHQHQHNHPSSSSSSSSQAQSYHPHSHHHVRGNISYAQATSSSSAYVGPRSSSHLPLPPRPPMLPIPGMMPSHYNYDTLYHPPAPLQSNLLHSTDHRPTDTSIRASYRPSNQPTSDQSRKRPYPR